MTWPVWAGLLALAIAVGLVVSAGTVATRLPCRSGLHRHGRDGAAGTLANPALVACPR